MHKPPSKLLAADEPHPVILARADGRSPFFLAADHAGRRIPRSLGSLGLPDSELTRHIAWDIGIEATSRFLADALDAFLIGQAYSRLVIDCNRDLAVPTSIVEISEHTEVPGNRGLGPAERRMRQEEVFWPYHRRLAEELDRRKASGRATVLVSMHSFTPVFKSIGRQWHVGVLYNRDPGYARILLDLLEREGDLVVGDNEPYRVGDLTDYTIPVHGERRGLPHVEIEIRQDLIADEAGQRAWATRLTRLLPEALRRYEARGQGPLPG
jgi:predicted N-formylglutamate amidohydrolase